MAGVTSFPTQFEAYTRDELGAYLQSLTGGAEYYTAERLRNMTYTDLTYAAKLALESGSGSITQPEPAWTDPDDWGTLP